MTVDQLAQANPNKVVQALADRNAKVKTLTKLPTTEDVETWHKEAKELQTTPVR